MGLAGFCIGSCCNLCNSSKRSRLWASWLKEHAGMSALNNFLSLDSFRFIWTEESTAKGLPPGAGSVNHHASCRLHVLASALCKVQFQARTSTGKQSARPLQTRRVDNSFLSKSLQVFQNSEHVDRTLNSKNVNDPTTAPVKGFGGDVLSMSLPTAFSTCRLQ